MIPPTLAAARADALIKRARLQASVAEAKHRLSPSTIASGVADDLRDKAEDGVAIVMERPGVAAGIATSVVALLARKRIARLFRKAPPPPPIAPPPPVPNKE
ncbi:hypothetical protein ASE73_06910 [Sphingomonas sp. Leaf24]|uniref:hypothetical protein n=1 Tax=unclassified Sphingomonas TaxID=196159 RepID=UPI0006FD438F|nr:MULTISPECIES: hypothetical protein [unclassified Sphingomonas]KQM18568.1 hypothetical protein ASE50_05425 [Sphingomonas sp. Leaf5]KQM89329.1 hypothetical protein ASE73_06910 [Sphingomonas sp. Leaf24]